MQIYLVFFSSLFNAFSFLFSCYLVLLCIWIDGGVFPINSSQLGNDMDRIVFQKEVLVAV